MLEGLRGDADLVIDTSDLNVHQLTKRSPRRSARATRPACRSRWCRFGFKYGIPVDADYVADMRWLPNPHWVPELRPQTGQDAPVSAYVLGRDGVERFLTEYVTVLETVAAGYLGEGKRFMTVAIGCTGGKHRSVAMTEEITRRLVERRYDAQRHPPRPGARVTAVRPPHGPTCASSRSAAATACTRPCRRCAGRRSTRQPWSPSPTTAARPGRLRGEFGVLPPGDLRMALAALCGDDAWGRTWEQVLQHRFAGHGEMKGHVVGNLLIVSLWELLGDHVEALDWVGRLLGAQGTVLPMAVTPMDITAEVRGADPSRPEDVQTVRGQVEVATTEGRIVSISLDPADPTACPEAVDAVLGADWVVLGPGSWYTSVIPHLHGPRRSARRSSRPRRGSWSCSTSRGRRARPTATAPRTTWPRSTSTPPTSTSTRCWPTRPPSRTPLTLEQATASWGSRLEVADVSLGEGLPRHDTDKLAAAFRQGVRGRDPLKCLGFRGLLTCVAGSAPWP